jgi:hypothetical protein
MPAGKSVCPGCGLEVASNDRELDRRYNASTACRRIYDELSAYSMSHGDEDFIHQLVVDAYAAQHSGPGLKPITTAFALIGLYLTFERGFTGREVQRAHMVLGRTGRWPHFHPPDRKAAVTVLDVLRGITTANYRGKIERWGRAVWETWSAEHGNIARLAAMHLDI